jgi:ubiquinone/menaquinone biosynthesis C-methylase UbiE
MQRVDAPEILDSGTCSAHEAQAALAVLGRINRWFGGVATTERLVARATEGTGTYCFSLLEVAAGTGEVPKSVRQRMARRGVKLKVTMSDRAPNHLAGSNGNGNRPHEGVVADALALPFADGAFDLVSCSLFTHHLNTDLLAQFIREGLRVSRRALLINDLIRHPVHLALVYASLPIMRNRVAWLDGLTSVRRAYLPQEVQAVISQAFPPGANKRSEITLNYLFRMGVIVWKDAGT